MKKRMLITTIVMVLVVAIALTTSSLAWFTMSASVSISEVSFGAVTYDGAQLSVAGLARTGWGASASIGSTINFDPAQGEPSSGYVWGDLDGEGGGTEFGPVAYAARANDLTLAANTTAPYAQPTYTAGAFQEATAVTTTAAGNETAQQQVELANTSSAVFVGGFNVRNDGTAPASVTISAQLNVGRANLINPNGSTIIDGDESYLYGTPNAAGMAEWVEDEDFPYNEYMDNDVDRTGYGYFTGEDAVQGNFVVQNEDRALAGGLRVAVFTRTWTETAGTYTDANCARRGIYGFSTYKVAWSGGAWVVDETGSTTNDLYVSTPVAESVYSMTEVLADEDCYVATLETGIAQYPVTPIAKAEGKNTLPTITTNLAEVSGTTKSGIEVIVIVWMDGWDKESVPAAGGGRVSLAYSVDSVTA